MKMLVTYASKSGWSQQIAAIAGELLTADGHEVTVTSIVENPDPYEHDTVIVFGGIRANIWHSDAADWLRRNAGKLNQKQLGIGLVCLAATSGEKAATAMQAPIAELLAEYDLRATVTSLAGGYDPATVNLAERLMMKAMKTAPCNHIDRAEIAAFVRGIVVNAPTELEE
ncbi:MAG: flavodoxin domain-containing protein [Propionibacteriaceae bacterium]